MLMVALYVKSWFLIRCPVNRDLPDVWLILPMRSDSGYQGI